MAAKGQIYDDDDDDDDDDDNNRFKLRYSKFSVASNIIMGCTLLSIRLTTLGLYGGSIFLSYKSCQSIVLKNG